MAEDTFYAWTVSPKNPGPLGVRFAGTEHRSKWEAEQRARRYEKAGNPCPLRKVTRSLKGTKYGEPYRVTVLGILSKVETGRAPGAPRLPFD